MTSARYLIGLDDTDAGDSIGTGALSRELMAYLVRELGVRPDGITRHQFLVHPDIPYTSHNSAACLAVLHPGSCEVLGAACRDFVRFLFHPGADPGLCLARDTDDLSLARTFGERAQREVLTMDEAYALGVALGVLLEEHGGTGQGVIGALGAVGLRSGGNDGRFIGHLGLRNAPAELTVAELIARTAIELVVDEEGRAVAQHASVETNNWLRPNLKQHRIVLPVRSGPTPERYFVEKRKKGNDDM